jgi:uncharacterized protein YjbI with pentapeptide repeats
MLSRKFFILHILLLSAGTAFSQQVRQIGDCMIHPGALCTSVSLRGVDLHGADLSYSQFTTSDLSGADLTKANLNSSNFTRAGLKGQT